MTPGGLLRDVADTAMALKETYTADNGVSDLRPALMLYDAHGNRVVSVLLTSVHPKDVGLDAIALCAAWHPWAIAFISEGYVRQLVPDAPEVDDADWNPTRAFADGDPEVLEAVSVALHVRYEGDVSVAMPFRYISGHVVEWLEAGEVQSSGGAGPYAEVLNLAIDTDPITAMPPASARIECIDWLRDQGCVVVTV